MREKNIQSNRELLSAVGIKVNTCRYCMAFGCQHDVTLCVYVCDCCALWLLTVSMMLHCVCMCVTVVLCGFWLSA